MRTPKLMQLIEMIEEESKVCESQGGMVCLTPKEAEAAAKALRKAVYSFNEFADEEESDMVEGSICVLEKMEAFVEKDEKDEEE